MDENGSHVTWRELRLLVDPIQSTLNEVRSDVKLLLASQAGDEAVSSWQRWFFTLVIAVFAAALGSVIYVAFA